MYATTDASDASHAARSARPRPFSSRCTAVTPSISAARRAASSAVPSVEALSAITTRAGYGSSVSRNARTRRTDASSPRTSL